MEPNQKPPSLLKKGGMSTATTAKTGTVDQDNQELVQLMDECEKFMSNVSNRRQSERTGGQEGQHQMDESSDGDDDEDECP